MPSQPLKQYRLLPHSLRTPQTRLIAGPGTGKSSAIEQRVCWLLNQGIEPARIFAVSFTRASTKDLKERIILFCEAQGHDALAAQVRVSTLHSLALRTLRAAGLLARFPVDPLVLDDWELENIFDAEFGKHSGIGSKTRREDIRRYHEAYWSTGQILPPNYQPPDPPINGMEAVAFVAFHGSRTQAYACVLPGEIVRQCVQEFNAGTLNPVQLLNIGELIVDEFQDLNPMDLEFVHAIAARGVRLFVAGDDDQSIYSFRFANPAGIQQIPQQYPNAALHQLNECFRCTPHVLAAANSLIAAFPSPNRVPKNSISLYNHSNPVVNGVVHRWTFASGGVETRSVAESCRDLIQAGVAAGDILILLSNGRALESSLVAQLQVANVPFVSGSSEQFVNTNAGRLVLSILRIVCERNDYVAHRTLLGVRSGVGVTTCNRICERVIGNQLNYRDIFYAAIPAGVFTAGDLNKLNPARAICGQIANWQLEDTFGARSADLNEIVTASLDAQEVQSWQAYSGALPADMTLQELRDYVWSGSDDQRANILEAVYTRLGLEIPPAQILPQRVRIMTMHGAKGLSARVVFIPALEETILPGNRRIPYPGLVLEAARLLYVSVTRARATCIVSHSTRRFMNGQNLVQAPSRFVAHLNGAFAPRGAGLQAAEIQAITAEIDQL